MKISILVLFMSLFGLGQTAFDDKKADISAEDFRGKNLVSVFEELTSRGASDLKVVLIKPGNSRACRRSKVGRYCAEYATYSKTRRGLKLNDTKQLSFATSDWDEIDGPDGHLFVGGSPMAMKYSSKTNTVFIAKVSIKKIASKYSSMKFRKWVKPTKPVVAEVLPAPIYDFFMGDGACCPDCYYVHRSAGLPCSADAVCCVGQCSGDPSCNNGGGGGGSGGGGAGGGDDGDGGSGGDGCEGQSEVSGASIMIGDTECSFTGTVESVRDEGGSCVMIAVSGVITCDGNGGISTGTDTPAQTEGLTGGY